MWSRVAWPITRLLCAAIFVGGTTGSSAESPNLGTPIPPEDLQSMSITVLPDGAGAPAGSGTAEQGAQVYRQHCQACHGPEGKGGINDRLVGGSGSLVSTAPVKTVGSYWPYATTVLDYINRSMPYNSPGVLTNDELYAVTAYLLYLNRIIGQDHRLSASNIAQVRMPNRDGFNWPSELDVKTAHGATNR